MIWVRPLDSLKPHPLAGTDDATARPFWSPDSRSLGFAAGGKLKVVGLNGAPPRTVCDAPTASDGSWGSSGVILFDGNPGAPIRRVPASGGVPRRAVHAAAGERVGWPCFLPDGVHFLYVEFKDASAEGHLMAGSLTSGKEVESLLNTDSLARYQPSGSLLYVKDDTLVARPFYPKNLEVGGAAVPVVSDLHSTSNGLAAFSVSNTGVLVYRRGSSDEDRLVWVNRKGKEIAQEGEAGYYHTATLSPDGRRIATDITDPRTGNLDIWIRDLARGVTSRLTFDKGDEMWPVWSPDGKRIVFASNRGGHMAIYEKSVSGAGGERLLWACKDSLVPSDWSRDGRYIAVSRWNSSKISLWILPVGGKKKPFPLAKNAPSEGMPSFSPGGRYIAYMSHETGRYEIYVGTFPASGGKWQISTRGGTEPHWSADGKTIYFKSLTGDVMAVPVKAGAVFRAGVPKVLFPADFRTGPAENDFQAGRDGRKFLIISPQGADRSFPMTVVLNWRSGMKK